MPARLKKEKGQGRTKTECERDVKVSSITFYVEEECVTEPVGDSGRRASNETRMRSLSHTYFRVASNVRGPDAEKPQHPGGLSGLHGMLSNLHIRSV